MTNDQYHDNAVASLLAAAVIGGAASAPLMVWASIGGICLLFAYRIGRFIGEN